MFSSEYSYTSNPEKSDWTCLLENSHDSNILQSWEYGETLEDMGEKVLKLIFFKGNKPVAAVLGKYHPLFGISRSLSIGRHAGGGPVIVDGAHPEEKKEILTIVLSALEKECISRRILHVNLYPSLFSEPLWNILSKNGYDIKRFLFTPIHSISSSPDILWDNLHKKHRTAIKHAMNLGVTVVKDNHAIGDFLKLKDAHQKFRKYNDTPHKEIKMFFASLSAKGMCDLYFSVSNDNYISTAMILKYQKTIYYLYGASSDPSRELAGANTLLHWEIIRDAHLRGYQSYNMWGVSSPDIHAQATSFKIRFSKNVKIEKLPLFSKNIVKKNVEKCLYSIIQKK